MAGATSGGVHWDSRLGAVVGARTATTTLRDGELVTVDGAHGVVYEGAAAQPVATPTTVAMIVVRRRSFLRCSAWMAARRAWRSAISG